MSNCNFDRSTFLENRAVNEREAATQQPFFHCLPFTLQRAWDVVRGCNNDMNIASSI